MKSWIKSANLNTMKWNAKGRPSPNHNLYPSTSHSPKTGGSPERRPGLIRPVKSKSAATPSNFPHRAQPQSEPKPDNKIERREIASSVPTVSSSFSILVSISISIWHHIFLDPLVSACLTILFETESVCFLCPRSIKFSIGLDLLMFVFV